MRGSVASTFRETVQLRTCERICWDQLHCWMLAFELRLRATRSNSRRFFTTSVLEPMRRPPRVAIFESIQASWGF